MKLKPANPSIHIAYWVIVMLTLTVFFGRSWGNQTAAFFFISMLLPIVLGTSYFFNYILVPRYFIKKKYVKFGLYTFYTIVVSLYFQSIVLMFSIIYLGNFSFRNMDPNASDTILLAVVMYLLVIPGSLMLMIHHYKENQLSLHRLLAEKEKMKKSFLEITSNRKTIKIPYGDIVFIESLADYIQVNTINDQIVSKEKISHLDERLPDLFLRIHRSFIINRDRVKSYSYNEVMVDEVQLNIGRSYRKLVRSTLKDE